MSEHDRTREHREREAEEVIRERKDELPSQRDTASPEGGRAPHETERDRPDPKRRER